jgi:Uma2 family endonuclease
MLATIRAAGYDVPVAIDTSARPFGAEEHVHRLSSEEYERIVATGALEGMRVELLDGLLVDISPQDPQHAWIIQQLLKLCGGRLDLLRVQLPLDVAHGWMPEPDIALATSNPDHHPKTALLVAEVACSSQRVDTRKAPVYAHAGIPTYWLIDLPAGTVRVHCKPGPKGYASIVAKSGDDVLDAGIEGVEPISVTALLTL